MSDSFGKDQVSDWVYLADFLGRMKSQVGSFIVDSYYGEQESIVR
jgi:hypothetical protein